jgi:hypothetical protein
MAYHTRLDSDFPFFLCDFPAIRYFHVRYVKFYLFGFGDVNGSVESFEGVGDVSKCSFAES